MITAWSGPAVIALLRGGPRCAPAMRQRRAACSRPRIADGETLGTTEGLAQAAYLELDYTTAIDGWERAYAEYRELGDDAGAVRAARTLGCMHATVAGDWAVASGWIARAQTLAASAAGSSESGWVALNIGMFEGDRLGRKRCSATR